MSLLDGGTCACAASNCGMPASTKNNAAIAAVHVFLPMARLLSEETETPPASLRRSTDECKWFAMRARQTSLALLPLVQIAATHNILGNNKKKEKKMINLFKRQKRNASGYGRREMAYLNESASLYDLEQRMRMIDSGRFIRG